VLEDDFGAREKNQLERQGKKKKVDRESRKGKHKCETAPLPVIVGDLGCKKKRRINNTTKKGRR